MYKYDFFYEIKKLGSVNELEICCHIIIVYSEASTDNITYIIIFYLLFISPKGGAMS